MPRWKRALNLIAVLNGFAAPLWAAFILWNGHASSSDAYILLGAYVPIAFGITAGYHRLFAHRAFQTGPGLRYTLAILGSAAVQGPLIEWVSDHRKHHSCADGDGDPHSPHFGYGSGWKGFLAGLWNAHEGWLFRNQGLADRAKYSPDLLRDPGLRIIDRLDGLFVILGFAVPSAVGYGLAGGPGAMSGLLWGGFVRTALMHHITFAVNSICHIEGSRPYRTGDLSTNVGLLALPTLGEAWHNNHHAFPASAFHGLEWWQLDLTALMIRLFEKVGLVSHVVRPGPLQLARKERRVPITS